MSVLLQKDLQEIKRYLLEMCRLVMESVKTAVKAFEEQDTELAKRVIEQDEKIDAIENDILHFCLKILALHHPLAIDLRFITSAMSMIRDLERLGDQAVNIAELVPDLAQRTRIFTCPVDLKDMAHEALAMLEGAIDAFVTQDTIKACDICLRDEKVDRYKEIVINEAIECMEHNSRVIRTGVDYIIVAQNLERVADLATNIAEEVIYIVEGQIVRHQLICHQLICEKKAEKQKKKEVTDQEEIFKKSPKKELFECLENHARHVLTCTERLPDALIAYFKQDYASCQKISQEITNIEREADRIKQNIRAHLPRGIIMPVDRFELFLYLKEQDAVADAIEDILKWLTFRRTKVDDLIAQQMLTLAKLNIETSKLLIPLIEQARIYFSSSDEKAREEVKQVVRTIRTREHESDVFATELKRNIFALDLDALSIYHLLRMTEFICDISGRTENAADLMRAMIAKP